MSYKESLKSLVKAFSEFSKPPVYCSGTVPLTEDTATLFYKTGGEARMVEFMNPNDAQLSALAEACQQATFGLKNEDVLDENYRKAGKIDARDFATLFSPVASGIVDTIQDTLMRDKDPNVMRVEIELYKLNVYGPGSFFKEHVDTPRSDTMFGSLVVVFPTQHEGGALIFRHAGNERVFDTAQAVRTPGGTPQAAFVAFYSDVAHEVAPVVSGYRVTLTYNLYLTEVPMRAVQVDSNQAHVEQIKAHLSKLLQDPTFFPEGGLLGFSLSHMYPFDPEKTKLSEMTKRLKVDDANTLRICSSLGLDVSLKTHYEDSSGESDPCLLDSFVPPDIGHGEIEGDIIEILKDDYEGMLVYDVTEDSESDETEESESDETEENESDKKEENESDESEERGPSGMPIVWIKPLVASNQFESKYVAYGNEAYLDCVYGHVCLVATVKPAGDRGVN